MRTKGEQKGGGTEKTEKTERESLPFQPLHSAGVYLFRHQPAGFQKGPVREGAPCPAHWGDQAQKPAPCTSAVGLQPRGGILTYA